MTVREDDVVFPNGARGVYGVVEKPDFVAILPIGDDGRVHLVQQHRYPVDARYWELPQGSWEGAPDADPSEVARGELCEETGLIAAKLELIGRVYVAYGYSSQAFRLFVATGLTEGPPAREATESDMISRAFDLDDIKRMTASGDIVDACTIAAFGRLALADRLRTYFPKSE